MRVQFIQTSYGGVLRHTLVALPHDGARWSSSPSPSCILYGKGGGQLKASTLASTGPSTILSTAASAGASSLPMLASSDFERFEDYKIGPNAAGQWEWFTADKVSTGGVGILGNLQNAYEVSTTVESHDLLLRVSSGELSTVTRDCRATWSYTVAGPAPEKAPIERRVSDVFHVAKYAPRYSLTEAEVLQEIPAARQLINDAQRIDLIVKRLWHRRVLPDIAKLMRPGAVVSGEDCDELLLLAFQRWMVLRKPGEGATVRAEMLSDEYRVAMDELRNTLLDLDESGGTDDTEIPRGSATPRLLRG